MTDTALIQAVRALGSDPRDLRDAAHEACHALDYGVVGPWGRENIHSHAPDTPGELVSSEVLARAVERIVCRRFGQPLEDPEHWVALAGMEMLKNSGIRMPYGAWCRAIDHRERSREAAEMADRVIALAAKEAA